MESGEGGCGIIGSGLGLAPLPSPVSCPSLQPTFGSFLCLGYIPRLFTFWQSFTAIDDYLSHGLAMIYDDGCIFRSYLWW